MTQVADRVALPIRVHDLLLGLAGRLDDDGLTEARELLASAEVDRSLELVAGCLNAGRVPLVSGERGELRELFAESHLDTFLVEHLTLGQAFPRHRFHPGPPGRGADLGVGDAIRKVLDALPDVRAVWAVWRTTPAGPVAGPVPHRVVLVEIGAKGFPPATAYRISHALRRSGIRASVEVLRDSARLTDYHRQAMQHARRVLSDEPDTEPERAPAPVQEERRSSWRDRRSSVAPVANTRTPWGGDRTSELEQSEPAPERPGPRSGGPYRIGDWRQAKEAERGPKPVPKPVSPEPKPEPEPRAVEQPEPKPERPERSERPEPPKPQETTTVIPAISAAPALASVDEEPLAPPTPSAPLAPTHLPTASLPIPSLPTPSQPSRGSRDTEANAKAPDTPGSDTSRDTPSDLPSSDTSGRDLPSRDLPNGGLPNREIPNRDIPNRDIPNRDIPNRDIPTRDIPLSDTAGSALAGMDTGGTDEDRGLRPAPDPLPSSRGSSSDGAALNEQEKDLLRQLQEELAKRERAEEADRLPWRTDRSGRHHDAEAKWVTGPATRMINGVPPGSGGGEPPRFPPGA